MASVSVSPPSSDGTTNDYGSVTGLSVTRATTSSSSQLGPYTTGLIDKGYSTTVGTSSDNNHLANDLFNMTNSNTSSQVKVTVTGSSGSRDFTIQNSSTALPIGSGPYNVLNSSGDNVAVKYKYYYTRTTSTTTYTFTNNTGNSVTVEGTAITNGNSAEIALDGVQFDITYVEYVQEESQPEEEPQPEIETQTTPTVTTAPVIPSVYVYGTGATGFGTGLTGYFYPLYTDTNAAALSNGYHIHTFTEYDGYTFYMPNNSMNHALTSRPTSVNKFITGIPELDNLEPTLTNPDYATLLPQIAAETDAVKKQALIDECYQFKVPLTQEEEDLFGYINSGYIQDNPNASDGTPDAFISHVGVYYDEIGRNTGEAAGAQTVSVVVSDVEYQSSNTTAEFGIGEYGVDEYGG